MKPAILLILQQASAPMLRMHLLWLLNQQGIHTSDRAMRAAVEELIHDGECIASSDKGYQLITQPHQVLAAVQYLKLKSKSIAVRGNFLIHNWRKKHPENPLQLELQLFAA